MADPDVGLDALFAIHEYDKYAGFDSTEYGSAQVAEEGFGSYEKYPVVYDSYSGADIVASIMVPGEKAELVLGELQTISYSIHRENKPVRILGHTAPCGFVRGPRTIAGSLIFTQFNKYLFYRLQQFKSLNTQGIHPLADMLPPFDVLISFSNEYGRFSKMKIYGVTIVDEGGTFSVDDLYTEQTYTYIARGIQPMVEYLPQGFERKGGAAANELHVQPTENTITFR